MGSHALEEVYRDLRMLELCKEAELRIPQRIRRDLFAFRPKTTMLLRDGELSIPEVVLSAEEQKMQDLADQEVNRIIGWYWPQFHALKDRLEAIRAEELSWRVPDA